MQITANSYHDNLSGLTSLQMNGTLLMLVGMVVWCIIQSSLFPSLMLHFHRTRCI